MRTRDLVTGGTFLALGIGAAYLTTELPERSLPNTPGPAFFPWVVTISILVLAALLIGRSVLAAPVEPSDGGTNGKPLRGALLALAAFMLYLAALPGLGFILATAPFFAVLTILYGERRPVMVVISSLAATIGVYVLFRHGFQIILPQGVLTGLVG